MQPEVLAKVFLLRDLTPGQLAAFAAACRFVTCEAQEIIIREGSTGDEMYILQQIPEPEPGYSPSPRLRRARSPAYG